MSDARPPRRRLRLALWLHADDVDSLTRELGYISQIIDEDDREERNCTGGGFHFEIEVADPGMTPERYRQALDDWMTARRLS